MLGTIKRHIGNALAVVERALVPPAPLPAEVLASRVVLVGASVSMHWHVEVRYPSLSVRAHYAFDKTPVLDALLREPAPPDAVILKQCAAYFPEDLEPRKPMVLGWLDRIREAPSVAILATVVPVTRAHADAFPGRIEGILEYNGWIRGVASDRGIALLDLEAALRTSHDDPHLDPALATRDGLHLRRVAYRRRLDPILQPVLVEALGAARPSAA